MRVVFSNKRWNTTHFGQPNMYSLCDDIKQNYTETIQEKVFWVFFHPNSENPQI